MAKKLFVGNLPFAMADADLNSIFSAYGAVTSANVVIDKFSKRSKGFGFVEFENEEDAAKAISMFDGKDFEGRNITVNEARPMEERPRGNFQR